MNEIGNDISLIFIELGLAVIGLAVLVRLASLWGFSAIPLYLLAGIAFGKGGLLPLNFSKDFIHVGAEIGPLATAYELFLVILGLSCHGYYQIEDLIGSSDICNRSARNANRPCAC